jgi:hypothetical protein
MGIVVAWRRQSDERRWKYENANYQISAFDTMHNVTQSKMDSRKFDCIALVLHTPNSSGKHAVSFILFLFEYWCRYDRRDHVIHRERLNLYLKPTTATHSFL